MTLSGGLNSAAALICKAEHHQWVCRPPVLTAVLVGFVAIMFMLLILLAIVGRR